MSFFLSLPLFTSLFFSSLIDGGSIKKSIISFANSSGFLVRKNQAEESINIGNISFQIRYKYEIAPLSNFYFVYTRGGGYDFDDQANTSKIIRTTWREPEGNRLAAKVRIRF